MIAVDTNVVVRFLTNDEPRQAQRAAELFRTVEVLVPKTVILESEWVLRHAYGLERSGISEAFRKLLGLSNVSTESAGSIARALEWFEEGMDFADALHLSSGQEVGASALASFDRPLARMAARLHAGNVVPP